MTFKFPLATTSWGAEEYAAIARVTASGMFSMGPAVAEFERRFAEWQSARYAVMVNSGSSANLLMTAALFYRQDPTKRLIAGDEVIVPAVSWATTYYPLTQYGLRLKFVDIDLDTLNFDLAALEAALTPSVKAILAVNLLGNPNDFAAISKLIEGKNILLLEDNCESMGATFQGRKAGSFGVMGTFSSFFSHHISTMEGGVIVTDDEELYHILLSLRAHGWTRNLPKDNAVTGTKSDDAFAESFNFVLPGYNVRPLEMSGALGIEQVARLPGLIGARRENGARLQDAMTDHPHVQIQAEIGESSWFGFSLVIRPSSDLNRNWLRQRLEALGFEARPVVGGNFTRNPVMKWLPHTISGPLTNADRVHDFGLFVGNHHYPITEAVAALRML